MLVERDDKRPEPRAEEIQRDWPLWAIQSEYTQRMSIPIEYEGVTVTVDVWENPAEQDRYLIYLPRLPHTAGDGGERIFITRQDSFTVMIDAVKKIASVAMIVATEKWKVRQDQKNLKN